MSLADGLTLEVDVSTTANPGTWLSILGDSTSVKITRGGQPDGVLDNIEPGLMAVTVLSAAVDPTMDPRVRPGAAVRLYHGTPADTIYTGRLDECHADYSARKLDPDASPRVTLTAFDARAELARERHPYNYRGSFSSKAKAIMLGSAVPYAAGTDPTSTEILAARDNTARWTQLELARNSHAGAAVWVDRFGVLHAEAAPTAPGTLYADALEAATSFTKVELTFGSKALVNALDLSRDSRDEPEPPRNYGTYTNPASIAEWGQVGQGIEIVDGTPSTLARYYLERTSTPTVAPARLEFDAERTGAALALEADVYSLIQVRNTGGVDGTAWWQIIGIEHDITPHAWRVALTLRAPATAESIDMAVPPAGPETGPIDYLPGPARPSEPVAVSRLGAVQVSWDGLDAAGAALGAEFEYAEVWQAGDPPRMVGRIDAETVVVVTDLAYAEHTFYLVAVDRNGHRSDPSDPVYVTVAPVVDTDLIGEIVAGANIVDGSIEAADKIVGNSITGNLIQAGTIEAGHIKAGAIDAEKIAAGAIDGMTITGATIKAGVLVTGDREVSGDPTQTGVYMSSAGYMNIKAAGKSLLTVNPYAGSEYFMVGDRGSTTGGYLNYDIASEALTIHGSFELRGGPFRAAPFDGHGIRIDDDGRFRVYALGTLVHQVVPGTDYWENTVAAYYVTLNARGGLFTGTVANDDVDSSLQLIGRGTNGMVSLVQLGSNSAAPYIRCKSVYDQTGGSSSNVYTNSSGVLYRVSSATKYKINVQPAAPVDVLALEPVTWYDKGTAERYADYLTDPDAAEADELDTLTDMRRIPGLLAEDVEKHMGPEYVEYGPPDEHGNAELEGVLYDRLAVALIPIIRDLSGRIDYLERENKGHG